MILRLQRQAEEVFVHNLVAEYIVRLVLATRTPAEFNLPDLTSVIQIGCSPRATLGLVASARALALIHGRDYVLPTDVQSVAKDVMAHRIVLGFDAVADNIAPAQVIERIVAMVPPPTPVWNQQAAPNHQSQPGRAVPSANTSPSPPTPYQQPVPNMPNQPDFK
jgi:MoxR-like ATPase